eukprot:13135209-Ditylum_brightwellii.AAC.2
MPQSCEKDLHDMSNAEDLLISLSVDIIKNIVNSTLEEGSYDESCKPASKTEAITRSQKVQGQ